jgi:hypothetical protein
MVSSYEFGDNTVRCARQKRMQITEPLTMLTDYALGVENLFFTLSIYAGMDSRNRVSGLLLLLGFLAQSISAFAGGTFHGFAVYLQAAARRQQMWNLILITIGATLGFLASGIHAAEVHRENGKWIVAGVTLGVLGLGIQVTGFRAHQFFNHNDIFHVIQIVAMGLFFVGARRLKDRTHSPK